MSEGTGRVFVDTTCGVRCAWTMPVYMSVKVNTGGGESGTPNHTQAL